MDCLELVHCISTQCSENWKKYCKSYLLLHWDEAISIPSILTSENGEPEAKIALPPVHLCACSAVHSALEVGLESGKIIGGLS